MITSGVQLVSRTANRLKPGGAAEGSKQLDVSNKEASKGSQQEGRMAGEGGARSFFLGGEHWAGYVKPGTGSKVQVQVLQVQ